LGTQINSHMYQVALQLASGRIRRDNHLPPRRRPCCMANIGHFKRLSRLHSVFRLECKFIRFIYLLTSVLYVWVVAWTFPTYVEGTFCTGVCPSAGLRVHSRWGGQDHYLTSHVRHLPLTKSARAYGVHAYSARAYSAQACHC
jgi:hypothetical protein